MPATPANRPDRDESPVRDRGDACPGALRLHTADDGALARVRVPAGLLSARQAHALADAADRLGDGALDITSRGNLQLRGLDAARARELADLLDAADLLPAPAHERVRNVVASPLSGLDGHGHLDVQPLVRELDALLCTGARAAALSGRFLFALDDGRGDMAELNPDVMLIAEPPARTAGGAGAPAATTTATATVTAPGTATVTAGTAADGEGAAGAGVPVAGPPGAAAGIAPGSSGAAWNSGLRVRVAAGDARVLVRPEDGPRMLMLAAEAFLDAADACGTRPWRIRELPPQYALSTPGLLRRAAAAGVAAEPVWSAEPAEPVWSAEPAQSTEPAEPAEPARPAPPAPGAHARDGVETAVCAGVVLGRMSAAQVRSLARVAERHGTGELRVTPWRSVVLPGVAAALLPELAAAGLVTGAGSPWHGVSACTGRPGCGKALADVRADAAALADVRADAAALAAAGAGGIPVHWSGCGRRCGHPHGGHVDLVATGEGRYTLAVVPAPGALPAETPAPGAAAAPDPPVRHDPAVRHDLHVPELAGALAAARGGRPLHHRPATTK
ncbi:cobalamin biosynthesis protein CobG [Streptomyces genisteinicus]|nr:cobalamin biosynthesis protein CobG [Streptomyces genisteinicus]